MSEENKKKFSCSKCGESFGAYPPDDIYKIASVDKREGEKGIERSYMCSGDSKHKNTIYWYKPARPFAISKK
ncbi:MAG: hypothetical protein NWE86_00900 [Candidatus Bathyarchaeota archaeon]|nr:hypothetical protein [Candidatus Bathyarchaeota archaeon]